MTLSIELLSNPSAAALCYAMASNMSQQTTTKIASFPSSSSVIHYLTKESAIIQRQPHIFARIQPHHVINTLLIIILIGFLSWSLDSQHGETLKYIEPIPVVVESISSIDPKADRRKSILQKNRRERRRTIENIAQMLEIEDQKRQEIFGPGPSPLDTSAAAFAVGIGGGDVGLRVWSLNQEMHLIREIDLQLVKAGLGAFANPNVDKKPTATIINKNNNNNNNINNNLPQLPSVPNVLDQETKKEKKFHFESYAHSLMPSTSSKTITWKTSFLLRLRVPLKWVM